MRLLPIILTIVFLTVPLTNSRSAPPIQYEAIASGVIAAHKKGYGRFAGVAGRLQQAISGLCATFDKARLDAAHAAFHDTVDAWQTIEHIRSGPATQANLHLRINFWPDRRDRVGKHTRRLLAKKKPITSDSMSSRSVAVQGLPALEYLLFTEELNQLKDKSKHCSAAQAIAANISEMASSLASRWRRETFAKASAKKISGAFFNNLVVGLQVVSDLKLGRPLGEKTGRVRPYLAENSSSHRALRNVAGNLASLEQTYLAIAEGAGTAWSGTPKDKAIRAAFAAVVAEGKTLGRSLGDLVKSADGREKIKRVIEIVRALRLHIVLEMAKPLGLTVGFNSFDGD